MTHAAVVDVATPREIGGIRWFLLWLAAFYGVWLAIVVAGDHWRTLADHWGISVAMAAGSYVAGSTPMGGGTIGFPILVLLFDLPAKLGRDFGFAIQSIGMTSASIFIIATRRPVAWRILGWTMLGSLLATPLAVVYVAPRVDELTIKLLFAVAWASFGTIHLLKLREICAVSGSAPLAPGFACRTGLIVGVAGGALIASITGVGIDLLLYVVLVLLVRADLKIAIPTSVIIMAWTSLIGIATLHLLARLDPIGWAIDPELFGHWLAAAPVVALGAPFGVFVVQRIGRRPTLLVVSILCLGQLGWTLWNERAHLTPLSLGLALAGLVLFNAAFHRMYAVGKRREARRGETGSLDALRRGRSPL